MTGFVSPSLEGLRVVLVAEYGLMGGTRTYFKQIVDFYLGQHCELSVIRQGPDTDSEMNSFLNSRQVPFLDVHEVTEGTRATPLGRLLRIPIGRGLSEEAREFRQWAQRQGTDVVVASVGTPGRFLGAVAAAPLGLYLLHTYPHGRRAAVFSKLAMPDALPKSARLVTVSNFARNHTVTSWHLESRSSDVRRVYSTAGLVLDRTPRPRGQVTVLTLGHVEAYKGPAEWIDIAASVIAQVGLEATHFTWAGDGSLLDDCRRRVRRLGLESQVHFIGQQHDVASLYDECTLYLQPSRIESLGLGVLDAARRGIPAVVSDAGGLPEVVQSGVSGMVYNSNKPKEGAAAVAALLREPSLCEEMGVGAQAIYASRFSAESWERNLLALHATGGG